MSTPPTTLLDELARFQSGPLPPLLVCVAHPDDETIGAGGRLDRLRFATFVYTTDGVPRDLADARAAGCPSRAAYRELRAAERRRALALAQLDPASVRELGCTDQEASLHMAHCARTLAALLRELRPAAVLTHAYEGGHPDHDATAFAVHAACGLLRQARDHPPPVIEFTSYHLADGALRSGAFLPVAGALERTAELTRAEHERKRRLLACYPSQRGTLAQFVLSPERFRLAPPYRFTAVPHSGPLFYELFNWGMTGTRWRALAAAALRALELAEPL